MFVKFENEPHTEKLTCILPAPKSADWILVIKYTSTARVLWRKGHLVVQL